MIREIEPGEIVFIDSEGVRSERIVPVSEWQAGALHF